ncbi:MAG: hypothetical protein AAB425_06820, partial [Bdellovibrionota bacterium]
FTNFERGRAKGADRHVEFVPNDGGDAVGNAQSGCTHSSYEAGNREMLAKVKIADEQPRAQAQIADRQARSLSRPSFYREQIRTHPSLYFLDTLAKVHPVGTKYNRKIFDGVCPDGQSPPIPLPDQLPILSERHTILAYYKPIIRRIGAQIYGGDFATWFDQTYSMY